LQGKTQLFPCGETDYYRNRLTHSLEVAQIAKSIAIQLNATHKLFKAKKNNIHVDIVELAGLAHDLGHPPFGHNGEKALDKKMRKYGGFEGNAQTLRILSKLEKKYTMKMDGDSPVIVDDNGKDQRCGLNLSARVLGALLKYDTEIKERRNDKDELSKGYYYTESEVVKFIKLNTIGTEQNPKDLKEYKTIECSIMDIADDIAYSTYDLEDAFKSGFLTPLDMIAAPDDLVEKITAEVLVRINKQYKDKNDKERAFTEENTRTLLISLFTDILARSQEFLDDEVLGNIGKIAGITTGVATQSNELATNGYYRTDFTSFLVGRFVRKIEVIENKDYPALSNARLELEIFKEVEVLKIFAYEFLIMSPHLKITEVRGQEIVTKIFEAVEGSEGVLLPHDFKHMYKSIKSASEKNRVVCDFIAGMTDRYAVEFYDRLFGTTPQSIHKPI
jgi:dGTPase